MDNPFSGNPTVQAAISMVRRPGADLVAAQEWLAREDLLQPKRAQSKWSRRTIRAACTGSLHRISSSSVSHECYPGGDSSSQPGEGPCASFPLSAL